MTENTDSTTVATVDSTATINELLDRISALEAVTPPDFTDDDLTTISKEYLDTLLTRLDSLEQKQLLMTKGLHWAAKELKPVYGLGVIAAVFDQLAEKASS